ncbi:hypothetical protein B0A48_05729 [Cryoendolithus antarcticus]|uniref:Zn(2)-C6 fungal-type domain-containing protein n=1 Tax=Cryoendolithus antarcticus TaxID=1507870 RepID=A0A1V8TBS8_9PEZI|nr:hypothetical protein B0A48_05729 [Cryoendolithus antarcticus]
MGLAQSPASAFPSDHVVRPDELYSEGVFHEMTAEELDATLSDWHFTSPIELSPDALERSNKGSQQHTPVSPQASNDQFTPSSNDADWIEVAGNGLDLETFDICSAYASSFSGDFDTISPLESHSSAYSMMSQHNHSEPASASGRSRRPSVAPVATQRRVHPASEHAAGSETTQHPEGGQDDLSQFPFDMDAVMTSAAVDSALLTGLTVNPRDAFYRNAPTLQGSWREAGPGASGAFYHGPSQATTYGWSLMQHSISPYDGFLAANAAAPFSASDAQSLNQHLAYQVVHNQQPVPSPSGPPDQLPSFATAHSHVAGSHTAPAPSVPATMDPSNLAMQTRPALQLSVQHRPAPVHVPTRQVAHIPYPSTHRVIAVAGPATIVSAGHHRHAPEPPSAKGGRKKNTHLNDETRQKSSTMRKRGACWRCAMQRDPCDGGDPCARCQMRWQKGQQYFFDCDRSKLPDFVLDFLPPSLTLMHQKQTIENCVREQVQFWDFKRPVVVHLTSGYGHPLRWTLYEFVPSTQEYLGQVQFRQDPSTGRSVRSDRYSPPLGITKIETSDDAHFKNYLDELMESHRLGDFPWTCFEEESQVNDFQATTLALLVQLYTRTQDIDLQTLLRSIIKMLIITYIMGHTLTFPDDTLHYIRASIQHPHKPPVLPAHTSPRLANRQLKFFFSTLRGNIYKDILKWLQATLHTSGHKESTWLSAFCVMLGLGMVLEEVQRTIQLQADTKAMKGDMPFAEAMQEARWACEKIDERFKLLVGLFQCKYRDKKWVGRGSFGEQTPKLRDPVEGEFLAELRLLVEEREPHLRHRSNVTLSSETQCQYTSRLVAKFLLPFLNLPVG